MASANQAGNRTVIKGIEIGNTAYSCSTAGLYQVDQPTGQAAGKCRYRQAGSAQRPADSAGTKEYGSAQLR